MCTQKILLAIFLLRLFFPVVVEPKIDYSDEYKQQQDLELGITTELPEYSEYLRRLGLEEHNRRFHHKTEENKASRVHQELNSAIHAPLPFPSIQLCKERPADGDYYGHIFCWTMVALFSMSIVSLIIYQLRSILWLKFAFSRDRQQRKEFELFVNGQQTNNKDITGQQDDKQDVPRVLSV